MAGSLKRYLLITRRTIPVDRTAEYATLWRAVQHHAELAGARAWVFTSENAVNQFIELIEWQSDEAHPSTNRREIVEARSALNAIFLPGESDTWIEAKI